MALVFSSDSNFSLANLRDHPLSHLVTSLRLESSLNSLELNFGQTTTKQELFDYFLVGQPLWPLIVCLYLGDSLGGKVQADWLASSFSSSSYCRQIVITMARRNYAPRSKYSFNSSISASLGSIARHWKIEFVLVCRRDSARYGTLYFGALP